MDFVFQGFQSGLPLWLYLLLAIVTGGLAWWSYQGIKTISPPFRYGLIFLRALTFFILLALLLNPFFRAESVRYEKPEMLVLFDNSASIAVSKGAYKGIESYRQTLSELNFQNLDRLLFRYFSVDRDVTPTDPDSLSFDGVETDLYNAMEVIRNNERDARAAVVFSDGIFNNGRNPVFLARELQLPVFTVALGDTSRLRDLIVQNIVTNATGYLNTVHPVEAHLLNRGFGGQSFEVRLMSDGEVLQSQTIEPAAGTSSHTVSFQLRLSEEGLQQFEVVIPQKEGEWTGANNSQPFSVEVLDDRQSILSLAFEIHPDVRMVRSLLLRDENTQLSTRTWLGDGRFVEGNLTLDPDTLDLVVLHGSPSRNISGTLTDRLQNMLETVPSIIMSTPSSRPDNLPASKTILPLYRTSSRSAARVSLVPALESTEHPVMELPEVSYERLPPVVAPIRGVNPSPGTTVLFNSSYQGTPTGQPLIAIRQTGNLRRAQMNGFGWFRIAQSTNPQVRSFMESLIYNLVSWTATKPDNRRLKIQPTQKIFTGTESVSFNAFLTNESGEVEDDGVVTLTISGGNMESRVYNMQNIGGGQYQLELGSLPEAIYQYEATAQKGNRTIDMQSGEFSVSGSNIEYVNTIRNDDLLKQLAAETGGTFYTFDRASSLWQDMDDSNLLQREERVQTDLFYPHEHFFWFLLVIVLLGAEWFLRKYVALP